MLNALKVVAQIAAGVAVGNVASDVLDKVVVGIEKVIKAKKGS
jgi:hypothetical protein